MESTIYTSTIVVEALPYLEQLVREHNRRVAKLAKRHHIEIAPATVRTVRTYQKGVSDDGVRQSDARWFADVEVTGQRAVISGWEIVGVLTATDAGYLASGGGVQINGFKSGVSAEILDSLKARGGQCDHCHTSRSRSVTYILRQGETVKLVGSKCLKDFTGHLSPNSWAAYADALVGLERELDELGEDDEHGMNMAGRGSGANKATSLVNFLGFVRAEIEANGWVSKAKSNETGLPATAIVAWEAFKVCREVERLADTDVSERDTQTGDLTSEFQAAKDALKPSYKQMQQAADDLELVADDFTAREERSDYEDHLLAVINQGYAFGKNIGLAASICAAADRVRREASKIAAHVLEIDEWFGTEKKREIFTLRCVHTQAIEGEWGTSYLHIFLDPQGRKAKWFSSSERLDNGLYELKATVKKHDTYEGKKTTQLSRCLVVRKIEQAQVEAVR